MSRNTNLPPAPHPPHGQIGYLQLPATDVAGSASFYESVFGWSTDPSSGELRGARDDRPVDRRPATGHRSRAGGVDLRRRPVIPP